MSILNKILRIFRSEDEIKDEESIFFEEIRQITGFEPKNLKIYQEAFTHRSANKIDKNGNAISYERLEFLGDAMLGSVIAAHLYDKAPDQNEGYLTKMRSKIVSRENLNRVGKELELTDLITGKISQNNSGENLYGNLFEALIGAVYIDKGYAVCERFIHKKLIEPSDIQKIENKVLSYKSILIEWCQKHKKRYVIKVDEVANGTSQKQFLARIYIDEKEISQAQAASKKKAEETASKQVYAIIQNENAGW